MTSINWDAFKCRSSAIKKMMSSKQGEKPISDSGLKKIAEFEEKMKVKPLAPGQQAEYLGYIAKRDNPPKQEMSDGCVEYLMEVYAWTKWGIIPIGKESMEILQLEKGKKCEPEALKMLNVVYGELWLPHKERISNDYLSGEIDAYLGESVMEATDIVDIKNAFDYPIFLRKLNAGLENGQREQVAGYCAITKAKQGWIANCLCSSPEEDVYEMRQRIIRKLGVIDDSTPSFAKEWDKWERSMNFERIPITQRVKKIPVEIFSENELTQIYDRVKVCREFLWKFDEEVEKMNL